jgi:hypothetical protein
MHFAPNERDVILFAALFAVALFVFAFGVFYINTKYRYDPSTKYLFLFVTASTVLYII